MYLNFLKHFLFNISVILRKTKEPVIREMLLLYIVKEKYSP